MFRDFQLIPGEGADVLFFPESVKIYAVPKACAPAVAGYLAHGGEVPAAIAPLLEKEAALALAQECVVRQRADDDASAKTDSLCLYLAHDCNLACTYCYNDRGRVSDAVPMMDAEVAEAAFRRYFTEPGRTYGVSFYGGEPLLNFKAMKRVVMSGAALERERGIRITYSMTTNGTVLSRDILQFIDRNIDNVTVSLDGPMEVNDRYRVREARGAPQGSYAKVLANFRRLREETRAKLTIKATLTGTGVPLYEQSLQHLRSLGADGVAMTPVNTASGNPAAIADGAYADYVEREVEHCRRFFAADDSAPVAGQETTLNMLANLLTKRKFLKHCDAGKNPAVTADGSLYACHGLTGMPEFHMGTLEQASPREQDIRAMFAALNVRDIPECSRCWARYLCGGACYAHAYTNTGSVARPDPRHCMLTRRQAEAVIAGFAGAMAEPRQCARIYRMVQEMINPAQDTPHG